MSRGRLFGLFSSRQGQRSTVLPPSSDEETSPPSSTSTSTSTSTTETSSLCIISSHAAVDLQEMNEPPTDTRRCRSQSPHSSLTQPQSSVFRRFRQSLFLQTKSGSRDKSSASAGERKSRVDHQPHNSSSELIFSTILTHNTNSTSEETIDSKECPTPITTTGTNTTNGAQQERRVRFPKNIQPEIFFTTEPLLSTKGRQYRLNKKRREELWYSPEEISRLDNLSKEAFCRYRKTHRRYSMEMLQLFQECAATLAIPPQTTTTTTTTDTTVASFSTSDDEPQNNENPVATTTSNMDIPEAIVRNLVDKHWDMLNNHDVTADDDDDEQAIKKDTSTTIFHGQNQQQQDSQHRGMERYGCPLMRRYRGYHVQSVLQAQAKISKTISPYQKQQQRHDVIENKDDDTMAAIRQRCQELLRRQSLHTSHAPRVMALILAAVDERQETMAHKRDRLVEMMSLQQQQQQDHRSSHHTGTGPALLDQ